MTLAIAKCRKAGRKAAFSLLAWLFATSVQALDPSLEASQYGHTTWPNDDAMVEGDIGSIAQTTDGYLWFGTRWGLLRFDGVKSVPWQPPAGAALPDRRIRALLGTRDGSLWIGTLEGLATLKGDTLVVHSSLKGKTVNAIEEDAEGTVWVAGASGGLAADKSFLCAFRGSGSRCYGEDGRFGRAITALYADGSGALWVAGSEQVSRWTSAGIVAYPLPSRTDALRHMTGTRDGAVIVGTERQLLKIQDGKVQALDIGVQARGVDITRVLCDRDGALWLAVADSGILHWHEGRLDAMDSTGGLSGDHVTALFQDREGSVWAATTNGIDRFAPTSVAIYSRVQGVGGRVVAVLPASDGSVWASTTTGLYRRTGNRFEQVRDLRGATLYEDRRKRVWAATEQGLEYFEGGRFAAVKGIPSGTIDGISGDSSGNVWVAHREEGFFRLRTDGKLEHVAWPSMNEPHGPVSALAVDPTDGSLWFGLVSGRIFSVVNGQVREALGNMESGERGRIRHLRIDPDGTLSIAARTGLHVVSGRRAARLDVRAGLPCDRMIATETDDRYLWIYTDCGLFQLERADVRAWAQVPKGSVARPVRVLNHWDDLRYMKTTPIGSRMRDVTFTNPKVTRATDGRLWLAAQDGVAVIDPARLPHNQYPPPVHVQKLVSDAVAYDRQPDVQLPPLQRNIEIEYTGLSFVAPEKVRFRYKLEGRDVDWQDAGNRRRVFYTDLAPGSYRFHVIAANNSGVWNEQGDSITFSVAPAWWQTTLFRACVAVGLSLLLYGLYRLRVQRLARTFSLTIDARVNERLRISRELHDTLLQAFQGALLKFHAAAELLPARPDEAKRKLDEVIEQAEHGVTEGRDAVRGLRASTAATNDLASDLSALGQELQDEAVDVPPPRLRVEVVGGSRDLVPLVRDEVHRIAREAVRNAFRHSRASEIDVRIHFGARQFEMTVRDNGRGIAPELLAKGGRAGHYGLRGMEERSQVIGGTLVLNSSAAHGVEVALSIAASRAYLKAGTQAKSRFGVLNDL